MIRADSASAAARRGRRCSLAVAVGERLLQLGDLAASGLHHPLGFLHLGRCLDLGLLGEALRLGRGAFDDPVLRIKDGHHRSVHGPALGPLEVGEFLLSLFEAVPKGQRPTLEVLEALLDAAQILDDLVLVEALSGDRERRLVDAGLLRPRSAHHQSIGPSVAVLYECDCPCGTGYIADAIPSASPTNPAR